MKYGTWEVRRLDRKSLGNEDRHISMSIEDDTKFNWNIY